MNPRQSDIELLVSYTYIARIYVFFMDHLGYISMLQDDFINIFIQI